MWPTPPCRPKHKQLSFPLTGLSVINSDYGAELSWPTSEASVPGVRSQRSRWLETAAATSWPKSATASSSLSKPTAGAIPGTLADHRSLVCGPATLTVRHVRTGGRQANSSYGSDKGKSAVWTLREDNKQRITRFG